ncbi:uncharacterized protein LOC133194809 [Saccostrea echinata]|uniref:uncharacterized protein LOC133194809 n=1 Tax=Saccostrea echinata TaxID=191078 RepID=UPI002A82E27E|nr:uncharacterized protein LOC133194809 [Saccostrea echinata]
MSFHIECSTADQTEPDNSEVDYFPYDPEVTDLTLIVEEKKIHVAKVVLMDASPVFRKMFTDDFKEKNAAEVHLPGKEYSSFVSFLRCICPREYVTLSESSIEDLLPIAHEYDVRCVLRKCEKWLLTELDLKKKKVSGHHFSVEDDVEYFMKCIYYGSEYGLRELYDKSFKTMIPYKLKRYMSNEFYKMLPEKNKRELTETRLAKIEEMGTLLIKRPGIPEKKNQTTPFYFSSTPGFSLSTSPTEVFQCSADLFI